MSDQNATTDYRELLKNALKAVDDMRSKVSASERSRKEPIAIVGIGCRFPAGSDTPERFWHMLHEGIDAVTEIPATRWDVDKWYDPDPETPGKIYCRYGSFIGDAETFDAQFFRISPREANLLDPQQRLLLETSWEALENAGIAPEQIAGSQTGVFIGASTNDYSECVAQQIGSTGDAYAGTGNTASVAAGRLSYLLGVNGPSLAIDTACSSSLVAVHLACQSLRNGECDTALAGGVNLMLTPSVTVNFCKARMLSPDGSCKTFDAAADGYVRGEGAGMVLLRRLSDAQRDGNSILAVVRASAINQDGRSSGLTVPNGSAQQALIRQVLASAGLKPTDIDYIEAHGTGTALGDPIELEALASVFGKARKDMDRLWVGSLKTNIGHLEAAAGISGLIKLVLSLQHEEIPPHLHFRQPTTHVDWSTNSLRVPTAPVAWPASDRPRIAGVSSFGFSGTNAHILVEEAPRTKPLVSELERPRHLLTLSAKSPEALSAMVSGYASFLSEHSDANFGDVCYTAGVGRGRFDHRLAVHAATAGEAAAHLDRLSKGQRVEESVRGELAGRDANRIAFLFTGQGSQYVGMGRSLYDTQPVFRRALDRCDEILRDHLERPLLSVLFPESGDTSPLNETAYTQPALFAIEYALAEMWMSWGIKPAWTLGHSVGEYVAACIAGIFSLEDGLKLIAARGRLMQQLPRGGAMVALSADAARVRSAIAGLENKISLAAVNSPRQVVLSGDHETLKTVVSKLETGKVRATWLKVSHAFHSPQMEPMLAEFEAICEQVTYSKPRLKVISNVTGAPAGAEEMCSAAYWRRHVREPVQFLSGIQSLVEEGARILLEVGPNPILSGLGQQCVDEPEALWLPSLRHGKDDWEPLLGSLGEMFVRGAAVDFKSFDRPYARRIVSLPTYPFQRQRFWVDLTTVEFTGVDSSGERRVFLAKDLDEDAADKLARELTESATFSEEEKELLPRVLMALSGHREKEPEEVESPLEDAYLEIDWEARPRQGAQTEAADQSRPRTWVVLADESGVGASIASRLEAEGHHCIQVKTPAAGVEADYAGVVRDAAESEAFPFGGILHFWNLDSPSFEDATWETLNAFHRHVSGSILGAVQALLAREDAAGARFWVVTQGGQAAGGSAAIRPQQSLAWGMGRVITLEHPERWGGIVDLSEADEEEQANLVREILDGDGEDQVAFRGAQRFVPRLTPSAPGDGEPLSFDAEASYLITGGLGALGREVAHWLADRGVKHLVLTSRSGASSAAARKAVEDLEEAGVEVFIAKVDAGDPTAMEALFEEFRSSGRTLKGIVHAAGISAVSPVKSMTADEFADVCYAKVMGAWNLHRLTLDMPLDFFVLFSSIASVWGSAGQAHYAAANQFLDILAHYRRANGRVALSTNWGPWSGSGMASVEARAWLNRIGVTALRAEHALQAMESCLQGNAIQKTIALVDWRRFTEVYEARSHRPFLERIAATIDYGDATREKSAEVIALEALEPEQQRKGILAMVREEVADVLGFASASAADVRTGLFDMGMDSISSVDLRNRLEQRLGWRLPTTAAFDYPTIQKMSDYLCESVLGLQSDASRKMQRARSPGGNGWSNEPIAIVGMAGRFPGAGGDLSRFSDLLLEGADLIREVPSERWDIDAYYDPDPEALGKMYCRYGAFLDDVDKFDPKFFGITPREALSMDPQQRLLLEVSWEALENAGFSASAMAGSRTGVFVGVTATEYARILAMSANVKDMDAYFLSGNALNAIAGRISHALEFHGPSASIDTACSSSLVTVHLACDGLRSGSCDMALAGGVNLTLMPESTLATCRARMLSADGSCKTFDAAADGYVRGEGAGMVLLKRLSDAEADGDRILAVIRGSAVNQDGRSSGLTVPNGVAQQTLIREALENAGMTPTDVDFIEAHGSGTALGDPIELEALGGVFRNQRNGTGPVWVASIKTNTGHLEAAAGITGLIKVVLALEAERIPPHIHFKQPTHLVDWDRLPLRVPTESVPWERGDRPRVAGVSSFGFSGTNAHIVVEESPVVPPVESAWQRPRHLLPISAKTSASLDALIVAYHEQLEKHPELDLADIAFTAGTGRDHFPHRLALHAENTQDAADQLGRLRKGERVPTSAQHVVSGPEAPRVAFLFTGQGSQHAGMSRHLYETQPVYRRTLDRCNEILKPLLEQSLLSVLFPSEGEESPLDQTGYTQPALFAMEYALAEMWKSWGIEPAWAMGHSVGEYVAACVAGVFSIEDGLKLIAARGRLMQALPPGGAMVALMAEESRVASAIAGLEDKVSMAALNGPRQTVVSGEREALELVVAKLEAEGIRPHWLQVSHAFHSPRMDAMLEEFAEVCRQVDYAPPRIQLISNLTGEIADESVCTPDYWLRHVREPVRFAAGMTTLVKDGAMIFLEVGPQPILIGMAKQFVEDPSLAWLPSLPDRRGKQGEWDQVMASLCELYARGAHVNFKGFDQECTRRKVDLPTYRFQKQRFWPDVSSSPFTGMLTPGGVERMEDAVLGNRLSLPRSKEVRFQTTLKSNYPHFLDDHRLFGTVVCPGASHIATMLVATKSALKEQAYVLEDVYFPQALVLQDGADTQYQLALLPEERGAYFIQAMSLQGDDGAESDDLWLTHAAGKLRKATEAERQPSAVKVDIEAYKANCSHVIEGTAFYDSFWKAGYTLGESFQWVERIWRNDWEGLTLMRVPDIQEDLDDYVLHPGLIDSCLQALAAFGKSEAIFMPGGENIRIPFHVGRVRVFSKPKPGPLWFFGKLEGEEGKDPVGSFHLFDEEGNVIIEVEGYESRRISKAMLLAALQEDIAQWMFEIAWREQAAVAESESEPQQTGSWIVLADGSGVAAEVANQLAGRGERAVLVSAGDGFKELGEDRYEVDPDRREDFEHLLERVMGGEDRPPCRGIVHLWSLDSSPATDTSLDRINDEIRVSSSGVLHALQAWAARNEPRFPRWFLITRGAQAVDESTTPLSLSATSLWGLGRVLAAEHPELGCVRIDLDPEEAAQQAAAQLVAEILTKQPDEDQLAYRGQNRYAARLTRRGRTHGTRLAVPVDDSFRMHLSSFGVLDNLEYRPISRREPLSGEVEIAVETSGLNFRDVLRALGMLQEYERTLGIVSADDAIFGLECGGRIVAVGDQVTEFKEGDEVVGLIMGSMASHATVPIQYVAPKPANLSYEEAVASSFIMMTAVRALEHGAKLKKGDRILIHSAAGGVGQAAVQLAQRIGAEVFGTASQRKWDFLKNQGVDHVMNSRTLDFADEIMELTNGEGVDVVLNSLNGDYIPKSLSVLKPGGRFIEIGAIGIWDPKQVKEFRGDITYERFDMLDEELQNPGTMGRLMREVLGRFERGELDTQPYTSFPASEAIEAFRYVAQAKHIGKVMITLHADEEKIEAEEVTIRPEASYLVTGGLGALGLEIASWLAGKGARHLVLTGRSGAASQQAMDAVATLTHAGVQVLVSKTDVSDPAQVGDMMIEIRSGMPPLKGIVHAAGLIADGMLMEQNWDQFAKVLAPKVAGAWNLHEQTRHEELDFFISFSSISSLLGSAGQGNYATANAFLDGLARQMQREGHAGLSINWGPWSDVGMAAGLSRRDRARWAASGIGLIPTKQGLELFGELLSARGQVGAVPIDWSRLLGHLSAVPLFREFLEEVGHISGQRSELLEQLDAAPPEKKREILFEFVTAEVARVIGLDKNDPLPLETGFFELGIDSLTAVELRNRLQVALGHVLPTTLIFNYPTINAMITYFADDVLELPTSDSTAPQAEVVVVEELSSESLDDDQLDDLSMEDMVDMLKERISNLSDEV